MHFAVNALDCSISYISEVFFCSAKIQSRSASGSQRMCDLKHFLVTQIAKENELLEVIVKRLSLQQSNCPALHPD